jgi:FixJ family two-component response regulator
MYLESANLGAFDFVHKPVKFEELKLVLSKIAVVGD